MHISVTQTDLYKLYYLFILKYYIYVSRPNTVLVYVTVTYLLVTVYQFLSVYFVLPSLLCCLPSKLGLLF